MKIKVKSPVKFGGYDNWSIKRTIAEAKNIARWSPWHAHALMEEALERISLDNPLYVEYDDAVTFINNHWDSLLKYPWFDAEIFWSQEGEHREPKKLRYIYQNA